MNRFDHTTDILPRTVINVKRIQRASQHLLVLPDDPENGRYLVESASTPGEWYNVKLAEGHLHGSCTCPWGQHGGVNCKHVLAALREHYAAEGQLSFWRDAEDARRQHRRVVQGEHLFATVRRAG